MASSSSVPRLPDDALEEHSVRQVRRMLVRWSGARTLGKTDAERNTVGEEVCERNRSDVIETRLAHFEDDVGEGVLVLGNARLNKPLGSWQRHPLSR